MSNYDAIRGLINKMSGQHNTFTVPKIYVEYTGDLTTAILLNQIVFLSDKSKRKDGYFYKTYKEWKTEICLTERQVRNSVNKLKKLEVVETKLMRANGSPTVHYKLHYDKLVDSILTLCQIPNLQYVSIQHDNKSESITETTTENTTETTTIPYVEIITYLNDIASKNYKSSTNKTKDLIKARWNEGFRVDDFKRVIDIKHDEWKDDQKMNKFIRPETLFSPKFEGYLNQEGQANDGGAFDELF
ncbi:conserved phage C-terminal domain-containing protein [Virgibacillus sp. C22-A2]|uniref:Conserved phage C-terminal domain-containing protein n=1 Tax=Virgibacillus tibetensis TaxID=3042313 RepID=A0ABU6KAB3_9BACI|nr:conserved phage C-terminal domain-containing protein [Virgibacillus sp. C22-A2]